MFKTNRKWADGLRWTLCVGALGLVACEDAGQAGAPQTPASLDELVVEDPNFAFQTSQVVRVELEAGTGALEVRDAEGRRMVTGGFATDAALDLRLPVGTSRALTVRAGRGAEATERTLGAGE